jgi:4a-hydroxytetrahydrobiopterin dehydratase
MEELAGQECEACRIDAPLVTDAEAQKLLLSIPDWALVEVDSVKRLVRTYRFKDFAYALAFTNAVGRVAEEANHHPSITTEWGMVTVTWWTHKIKGVHKNDFIMAARTEKLYALPA